MGAPPPLGSAPGARLMLRYVFWAVLIALLAALPPVMMALGQAFYIDLVRRIMIFAIAAVSLNLILGYGGLVSFGHAAYLGIGGYAVAIFAFYGVHNGFLRNFGTAVRVEESNNVELSGLQISGDHRDTSSIQGALVSGERAARAVLADLGV